MGAKGRQRRWVAAVLAGALLILGSGCASVAGDVRSDVRGDPRDPLEGFNRAMHGFNETFDAALAKPVARAYREVVPEPVRDRVRNFFGNIGDLLIGVNNLLQGKPLDALNDGLRFAFNSTFGLFGLHDVASEMGLEKHNEDFGQTLGRWGMDHGPYLVLPILGPSTVRDGAGLVFDIGLDPVGAHAKVGERNTMIGVRGIGQRTDLLDAGSLLDEAALDKYVFMRDAYLQRRRSLIYDGSPPRESAEPASAAEGR